jgi:hypothetical protein
MSSRLDKRKLIVFFHPGHPNYVGVLKYVRPALALKGYSFEDISFRDPSALTRLARLLSERSSDIFCLYSVNFHIKDLAFRNMWIRSHEEFNTTDSGELYLSQLTGIPLVVHIYDHPLYLMKHESDAFNGAIIFVNGADIIDFMSKHFKGSYTYVSIPIPTDVIMPNLMPSLNAPDPSQFLARQNAIWCPMNLSVQNLTLDGHWTRISELPIARRNRAMRLVDAALYDCLTPLHIVSERLAAEGDAELNLNDQLHVTNFVKLWRRTRLVRAFMDLPILVSSDFVPSELGRKYPQKFTQTSMSETLTYYERFRFTLNSFPLQTQALHDRVINAFFANSMLITDRNSLATTLFEDGVDLVFLDYDSPDMASKVIRYLDNPLLAYKITLNRYERRITSERRIATEAPPALCDLLIQAVNEKWRDRER